MKQPLVNILLSIFIISFITSCNVLKRVDENEQLLVQNTLLVDGEKEKSEDLNNLIYQQPNSKLLLGIPLRLHIYNLARENRDSLFEAWLNENPKRKERLINRYSKKQVNKLRESLILQEPIERKGTLKNITTTTVGLTEKFRTVSIP